MHVQGALPLKFTEGHRGVLRQHVLFRSAAYCDVNAIREQCFYWLYMYNTYIRFVHIHTHMVYIHIYFTLYTWHI